MTREHPAHSETTAHPAALDQLASDLQDDTPANALKNASARIADRFRNGESVVTLVKERAALVDAILIHLWRTRAPACADDVGLIAVGGYGRGELHPGSDIDVLLLLPNTLNDEQSEQLGDFVTALWDVGLEPGHSARTIEQCVAEAADLTTATTLMESRPLAGPIELFTAMRAAVAPPDVWPSAEFFVEKRAEQQARYARYDGTAYKLEPNIKGSPGGLRDIQLMGWVAQRHFGVDSLAELVDHGYLTPVQIKQLEDGRDYLWRMRFGLHVLTGRREDRILFDHQKSLAELLGFEDASHTLGVEQMMQRYYRTVMELSRINEMLLQMFEEEIVLDANAAAVPINERFESRNGYLRTTHEDVFANEPSALLEVFLLLQQQREVTGVSAHTITQIRQNLHRIDELFRQDPRNHRLFLAILRAPQGVTHELRRMNVYGVLSRYIPAFGRITGRMQYDLFHAYTVDEHTLFVVSNLRRFALTRFDDEFPHCSHIMQNLEKPELAYLGGLFHDIAKGRGGDHSELGATDAESFCLEQGLSQYDARLVAWLVRNHLLLSTTAQKKDIGDPDVINEFAAQVRDPIHLDYLYVLTVADVRGTNPKLWNSWKASLFRDLYEHTHRALRSGLENPIDRDELIAEKKATAREHLAASGISEQRVDAVWSIFDDRYFLRQKSDEIAWHTQLLADVHLNDDITLADVRRQPSGEGIEAFLYAPRTRYLFAQVTAALDEMGMTIMDARIIPLTNEHNIESYIFMEHDKRVETDDRRLSKLRDALVEQVQSAGDDPPQVTRRVSRAARAFNTPTQVFFSVAGGRTIMELMAADRPGLLSDVGRAFVACGVHIEAAKIMTIGERAEDVFYITDDTGRILSDEAQTALREYLMAILDDACKT
ncbi:MAG: [protein-PII] uridylyltransferase [Pseudomonadota bacterium]